MRFLALFSMLLTANLLTGQSGFDFWQKADSKHMQFTPKRPRSYVPSAFQTYKLDFFSIKNALKEAPMEFTTEASTHPLLLDLPIGDGRIETFKIWESPIMESELAKRWPDLRTYSGEGLRSRGLSVRLDVTLNGFHAIIFDAGNSTFFVEPYFFGQKEYYMAYDSKNVPPSPNKLENCVDYGDIAKHNEVEPVEIFGGSVDRWQTDTIELRKYRLAIASTSEYADHFGGTKAAALSELLTAVNTVTALYEREFDVRFVLVNNNDTLVFDQTNLDPYPNNEIGTLHGANKDVINPRIGLSNYDVGHVVTRTSSGGLLGLGTLACVCNNSSKANGASSTYSPEGLYFYSVVAHELGHQHSCNHIFNECGGNENGGTAYEPYCGSTIMGYDEWTQGLNFNQHNINEATNFTETQDLTNCASVVKTQNRVPSVSLPYSDGFFIPFGTPFDLSAEGSDPDGDALTYSWEQHDLGPQITNLSQPVGNCPLFRAFDPENSPTRIFPKMSKILANVILADDGEILPAGYDRDMTFNCTVRDNRVNGGGVAFARMKFKVDGQTGPFRVVSPNLAADKWTVGDFVEVKWDVAGSNKLPVNCQVVNIELSIDGGANFNILLAQATANDGSLFIQVPNNLTTKARVRIHAADNIFFDISNQNFKIEAPAAPGWGLSVGPNSGKICLPSTFSTTVETAGWLGFSTPINMEIISGLPPGAVATFGANQIAPGASAALGIDFNNVTVEGDWTVTMRAISGSDTLTRLLNFTTVSNNFSALALVSIADGTLGSSILPTLKWSPTPDANTYDFQLASSPSFSSGNIVSSLTGLTVTETTPSATLEYKTMYFWRVRPQNECGFGEWTEPFVFGTEVLNCQNSDAQDLPKNIAFSGTPSLTTTITVPFNAVITDINITRLQGFHENFKDLSFALTSPSGKKVWLVRQKCGTYNGNFNFGLDDEAASLFECPPADGEDHRPSVSPLSSFDGEQANGPWTMTVKDTTDGAGGTLNLFQLEFCASVALDPPFIVNNVTLLIDGGQNAVVNDPLLKASDNNNSDAQLTFTLVTLPKYGELQLNLGGPLSVGAQFTQADLNNGSLRFFDYGNPASDKFSFVVSDGEGGFIPKTVFLIEKQNISAGEPAQSPSQFVLAPNPAMGETMLAFDRPLESDAQLSVSNMAGQLLVSQKIGSGAVKQPIQTRGLPSGIYLVSVRLDGKILTKKLVVNR